MVSAIPPSCDVSAQTLEANTPIKIVLACENNAGLRAAEKIYRAIAGRLAGRFEFDECWLHFSAFVEPVSLERAVNFAAEAEIVFCCPNNGYLLPGPVQNWFRLWLARRAHTDGALAVLLPVKAGESCCPSLVEKDLRATARANGLAFFAHQYGIDAAFDSPAPALELFCGASQRAIFANEGFAGPDHFGTAQ